jgi:hypothetical protein
MKQVMAKNAKTAMIVVFVLLAILVGTLYQVASGPPR